MAQRQRKGTPAKGGGNGAFYAVLAVIALGGIVAIGYALMGRGGEAATEPIELNVTDARELYEQATPVRLGRDDAPVKVVEFADFQCPGCGYFSLRVRPRIMPYVEDGTAQVVFYDYPLGGSHIHSFLAARAARCAGEQPAPGAEGENAYWLLHDKIFQEQANWTAERDVTDDFVGYAGEVGLDTSAFERCLRSDRYADVVTANRMVGEQLGVRSTPTVLVNNRRVQGNDIDQMGDNLVATLEAAREMQTGAPAGGADSSAEGADSDTGA